MHTGEGLVPKKRQAAMDGGLHGKGANANNTNQKKNYFNTIMPK
ncbi:hypothetical protein [Allofranklinella schreckenbergeri]|nr:hypothetical protein [Allofranklinella schreckenbergeri]